MKTKNIPIKVVRDAVNVAGGLFRANAKTAKGYAFTVHSNNKEVDMGEFMFSGEEVTAERFDGYISFSDDTITNLHSNKTSDLPV